MVLEQLKQRPIMPEKLFMGMINPLAFLEIDEPWAPREATAQPEEILNYMCPTTSSDAENLTVRYKEISIENPRLNIVPAEDRILEKLIWPLRHAKASFVIGNNLGTISLCGMVAEMVAILYFDISDVKMGDKEFNEEIQKLMFGCSFEKLGQDRRVKTLKAFEIINQQTAERFDKIRMIRKRYLHLWSQDHDRLSTDAIESFKAAASIVAEIIGQDFEDGKIKLNPKIVSYLERTGVFEPEE